MSVGPLSFLADKLVQVAYVVDDLDTASAFFVDTLGVPGFYRWENLSAGQEDKEYFGEAGDFEFSAAYGYAGDVQIELCRHDSGHSIYKDWLDERGPGLHHIGYQLETDEEYGRALAHLTAQGFPVAMGARVPLAGGGDIRWCYLDTRSIVGTYTEIYWTPAEFAPYWTAMKQGDFSLFDRLRAGEL